MNDKPPSDEPPAMEVRGVSFGYAEVAVLAHLSATLGAGRVTCLLGPNAAGKSTLVQLMLGHLAPSSGDVLLGGERVDRLPLHRRAARMSYVPQRATVAFGFTVREVVTMGRYALPRSDQAVGKALHDCELNDLAGRVFSHLSVGQQQRVLLARALAQSADDGRVMLLDEPGSAMDVWHVHRMMQQLRQLAGQGMAVLAVVHDLNLAARYADDVWLLHDGRLVASGPWPEVLTPAQLEPVYRVRLRALRDSSADRPVFLTEVDDTLLERV